MLKGSKLVEITTDSKGRRRERRLAPATGSTAVEMLEALKQCEYALQHALRTNKIGWVQEEAHKAACAALEAARGKKPRR